MTQNTIFSAGPTSSKKAAVDSQYRAPDIRTLATEFESFDLLWYDIETRARKTMEEMTRPLLGQLVSNSNEIKQLQDQLKEKDGRIEHLETLVFERDKPLDVFERIYVRISETNAAVKVCENKVDEEKASLLQRMDEVDQHYGIQDKHYKEMKQTASDLMAELRSNQEEQKKQS